MARSLLSKAIDKTITSAGTSNLKNRGEARQHPKKWMKKPIFYRFSSAVDYGSIAAQVQPYCEQKKLTMTTDAEKSGSRFQKLVMSFVRWECAIVINNDEKTELLFQVLKWYDNGENEIAVLKLVSAIEKAILSIDPDVIVVEDDEAKKLVELY